jgi:hypothetical protein
MLKIKATLRVFSKELTLEQLTQKLGEPTTGYSIGDEYARGKRIRKMSFWATRSSCSTDTTLECHIRQMLTFLDSKTQAFNTIKAKCEIDIFCLFSSDNGQGSALFTSKLAKLLWDHDIDVTLDTHLTPEDD